ncbi:hypothetical protein LCGC14_1540670, partial [marine sediment metagenome]
MKSPIFKVIQLMVSVIVLSLIFSCSKDTDLLADYIIAENHNEISVTNLVVDDSYVITTNAEIVLDVLYNDSYSNPDKVKIVEVSQPNEGTVVINEDNTLTFIPESKNLDSSHAETPKELDIKYDEPIEEKSEPLIVDEDNSKDTDSPSNDVPMEEIPAETNNPVQHIESEPEQQTESPAEKEKNENFTYTVETEDENGKTTNETGEVEVKFDYGELTAFPEAEGFGKNTIGGRGGVVIHVTNLSDNGPGSLRNALEKIQGKRTIVFDVSGYIVLKSQLKIRTGYGEVTIAGQTAPGEGITLRGHGIEIWDSEVIIRYLRIRVGTEQHNPEELELDAIRIGRVKSGITNNIIVDHCSFSWATDELASINSVTEGASIQNVTYQNCIMAEAIISRYGMLVGAGVSRISVYNNLFAHNAQRNIRNSYSAPEIEFEFINNIIYDYNRATEISFGNTIDIIGNIYKINSSPEDTYAISYGRSPLKPDYNPAKGNIHQSDNRTINTNFAKTNSKFDLYGKSNRVITHSLINPTPSVDLENKLLNDLGANIYESPVDKRILEEYKTSTGSQVSSYTDTELFFGGYPILKSESRPNNYDMDRDGMSDSWEILHSLDPSNPKDGKEDNNGDNKKSNLCSYYQ